MGGLLFSEGKRSEKWIWVREEDGLGGEERGNCSQDVMNKRRIKVCFLKKIHRNKSSNLPAGFPQHSLDHWEGLPKINKMQ